MWSTIGGAYTFYIPPKSALLKQYDEELGHSIPRFKGIIYFSLDFGIIWNPKGKKILN